MEFIDLKTQYRTYQEAIDGAIRKVLDHGRFIMGPEVLELEEKLSAYVGVAHTVSCSSGTDSLLMALMALGVSRGDEVITTPFTWISTAEVIELLGAKSVFVDIEPETFNLDPSKLEEAITPRTKAIMPVSLFGLMADMEAIGTIAKKHNLPVVEDGAQSFGATLNGEKSCGVSLIGSTSFFPAKPLGCFGDGGALFTSDEGIAETLRAIRTHGGVKRHHHTHVGINGRLDTMQAAILIEKLRFFDKELALKSELATFYNAELQSFCKTPKIPLGYTHAWAQYTLMLEDRDEIAAKLKEEGIPTAVYYPKCLHEQPVFKNLGYAFGDFPCSEKASRSVLSLPMHAYLSQEDREKIIAAFKSLFAIA